MTALAAPPAPSNNTEELEIDPILSIRSFTKPIPSVVCAAIALLSKHNVFADPVKSTSEVLVVEIFEARPLKGSVTFAPE